MRKSPLRGRRSTVFATGLLLMLSACGSGNSRGTSSGGGGGGGGGGDGIAPLASITFPSDGAITEGDFLIVQGTASDADGVASVTVDGVAATTTDGYATWTASIPIVLGENMVVVATEDIAGATDPDAARVTVRREDYLPAMARGAVLDLARNRALFLDSSLDSLLAVDLSTGERSLVSGPDRGTGPRLGRPRALALDNAANRVLVADPVTRSILAVDLVSGNRTTAAGPYPAPFEPWRVVLDPSSSRLYGTDDSDQVFVIDLGTGSLSTFTRSSAPGVGGGPELFDPRGLALDSGNGRLLVGDVVTRRLFGVDLSSGDRTLLVGETGAETAPWDVEVNAAGTRAWVAANEGNAISELDLLAGTTHVISGPGVGSGPPFDAIGEVMLDEPMQRLVVLDSVSGNFVFVDLATGDRGPFSGAGRGTGPRTFGATDIVLEPGEAGLYVADPVDGVVWRFDLALGDRVVRYNTFVGPGPLLRPNDLKIDEAGEFLYAVDRENGKVFRLRRSTGERTILASTTVGSGVELQRPLRLDLDPAAGVLYVLDDETVSVVALDLGSLARETETGNGVGGGAPLITPLSVLASAVTGRLLVTDLGQDAIIAAKLATGGRVIFSVGESAFAPPPTPPGSSADYGPSADLILDEANARALQTSVRADGIATLKELDLATGTLALVSGGSTGGGMRLVSADAVEVAANGRTAWILDGARDGIVAVDLATGYRVLISKR